MSESTLPTSSELTTPRHGDSGSPEYVAWIRMVQRCEDRNTKDYHRYGGRGISVCEKWRRSYVAFLKDMGRKPSLSHSLDRIDNSGCYSPENCRWATPTQQARNRRSNKMITHNGEVRCLAEWAELLGFEYKLVRMRMWKNGWSFKKAISTPKRKWPSQQ
jgi:hypothetical protein